MSATGDSIADIWGPRTPQAGPHWPVRVDQNVDENPDRWVQASCSGPLHGKAALRLAPAGRVDRSARYNGDVAALFVPIEARMVHDVSLILTHIDPQRIILATGRRNWPAKPRSREAWHPRDARRIQGQRFAAVPFFWSRQYDRGINYVGPAEHWDRAHVDGNPGAHDCTVTYWRNDKRLAVATVGRDLDSLPAEVMFEQETAP